MKPKRDKRIRGQKTPQSGKQTRFQNNPDQSDHLTIAWKLSRFDWDGPWGLAALAGENMQELLRDWCCNFETQTWAEMYRAAGGRRDGNNNHPVPVEGMTPAAQRQLREIKLDDIDVVQSFRLTSKKRLYGIRDNRAFEALWFDPWHSDNSRAVYPTKKR